MSWSGGKDSSLALYEIMKSQSFKISSLITTVTRDFDRISMHGVRRDLLRRQSLSLRIPLEEIWINMNASNSEYESAMGNLLKKYKEKDISTVVFGDIFLEDLREYREKKLAELGMKGCFPLWKRDTKNLATRFLNLGFKAIVCCVDPKFLERDFCGVEFDKNFLSRLPENVDACGENGEFHTFVYAGPIFEEDIAVRVGELVLRDGFCFSDLIPA
jgi:uncharacterized protein (TIGR00290 family)